MPGVSAQKDAFVRSALPPRAQWPALIFTLPELQFPDQLNASMLLDRACSGGMSENTAVLWSGGRLSYAQLLEKVNRIANVLVADMGLKPGNRVLLHAPNTPTMLAAWWAVLRAGGVAVATMPMLRTPELKVIIDKALISHALVHTSLNAEFEPARFAGGHIRKALTFGGDDTELAQRAAAASPEFEPTPTANDDPAIVAFTSGTTGKPKGCVHFHRDILAMAETFSRHVLRPKPGDVFCGTPPFAFTFGLGASVVFPAAVGAATALPIKPGFDALADTIAEHRATTLFTSPTGYRALLKIADDRLSSLHTCVSAGEHLPKATSDAWCDRTGIRIIDGIGSTELIHIFISASGEDIRAGATGKVVPGYEACVLDEDDRPIDGSGQGRLAIKGPTGCRYLADDRQGAYVVNGWNVTGDIYRVDDKGYFWFVSRADDMIISAGYNIAAPEVENALLQHRNVAEAAVIGAPDAERGQIVKAFVVLREADPTDALKKELQDFVKRTIAPYKYPRAIEFVTELPKTQTGKLQRFRLREPQA
ncbi:MAG: AMP-binding protein [Hyphomonadaceae bacterium]